MHEVLDSFHHLFFFAGRGFLKTLLLGIFTVEQTPTGLAFSNPRIARAEVGKHL